MVQRKLQVAETEEHLRERVVRMLKNPLRRNQRPSSSQLCLFGDSLHHDREGDVITPMASVSEFLDFVCRSRTTGDLYLFGGVLRDVALYGKSGFTSDIDLVVDSDWMQLAKYYLTSHGARRNRFGGFRLQVNGQSIDIWSAQRTWAIRQGLVQYRGIGSLTRTTILNWDAILLNWRTQQVICDKNYFRQIRNGVLDIVLEQNPNPLGAVVRAFRHLCLHDARILTISAARFLSSASRRYTQDAIVSSEIASYRNSVIDPAILVFFMGLDTSSVHKIRRQFRGASGIVQPRLI